MRIAHIWLALLALVALAGCGSDGHGSNKKDHEGTSQLDGGTDDATGGDGPSNGNGMSGAQAACADAGGASNSEDPELVALESEQRLIAMCRQGAGLGRALGSASQAVLGRVDAMGSDLIEATMSEAGVMLPARPQSPPVPGACGATGQVRQALTDVPFYHYAYTVVLGLLPDSASSVPIGNPPEPRIPKPSEEDVTVDGVTYHLRISLEIRQTGEKSSVTVEGALVKTITGPGVSINETAKVTGTVDVCPKDGIAEGKFTETVDTSMTGKESGSSHLSVTQTFQYAVNDAAETTGIHLGGSMSFKSTGGVARDIAAHGTVELTPAGPPDELGNANIAIDRSDLSNADIDRIAADLFPQAWQVAQSTEKEARARWRNGACIEIKVDPGDSKVAPNSQTHLTATPHHKFDDNDLSVPVVATLDGAKSISPDGMPVPGPHAGFEYFAGCKKGDAGTVTFKSTSNRGIGIGKAKYTVDGDPMDTCAQGLVMNKETCMCECPGNGNCPDGSTWDPASSTCSVQCTTPGATVAGFPCEYQGTTTATATGNSGGGAVAAKASVRLSSPTLSGCSLEYTPSGTATITSYGGCAVSPSTMAISGTNTVGKFIVGLAPPTLIADMLTHWTATVTCPGNPPPPPYTADVGMIWVYALGTGIQPDADIVGTYAYPSANGTLTSSWDLKPAN